MGSGLDVSLAGFLSERSFQSGPGARFDHRFQIQGGPHGEVSCNECHTIPTQPGAFLCTDCHEHPRSEMDSKHREVQGYAYASPECYRCHPDGRDR